MVKKLGSSPRFPNGRLLVVARVHASEKGKIEESIALPEGCDRNTLAELTDRANKREAEMRSQLRLEGTLERSGSLKFCKNVLEHYKPISGHNPSVYNRLFEELGHVQNPDVWEGMEDLADRMESMLTRRKEPFSPASINRHITMLKAAYTHAFNSRLNRERMVSENYLSGYPTLEENNISFRVLDKGERDQYWDALPDWERPLYYFSCRIPIRISEAVNISRSNGNINQVAGTISLLDGATKNGCGRLLPIPMGFQGYWEEYLRSGADHLFNKGKGSGYAPLGYWCKKQNRLVWNGRKDHEAACDAANITGYNRHKTRQEAILSLYSEIRNLDRIQHIGGWLDRTAFERYYDKGLIEQIEQGMYQIDTTWHDRYSKDLIRKAA